MMEEKKKVIALIAHDQKKLEMVQWANFNREILANYNLVGTYTTATQIFKSTGLQVEYFEPKEYSSGPKGGDFLVGAEILRGNIDIMIFFIDPDSSHPHSMDINALIRIAALRNIPYALNRATADAIIISESCTDNKEK